MTARCIATSAHARCPNKAGKRSGDIYVCSRHSGLMTMALIDDMLAPATRRMLAWANWNTADEGQLLIDRMYRRTEVSATTEMAAVAH